MRTRVRPASETASKDRPVDERVRVFATRGSRWIAKRIALLRDPAVASMTVIVAFMAWFYLWTTASSGHGLVAIGHHQTDYYNLLGSAFLHGHLDLYQIKPPAGLLHVADPYSSAQNAPYRNAIFDLSLYHGKLYAYWGPAPALILYLPWRILFPGDLPQPLAAAIFCWVGLVFAVALLRFLVRRFAPNTPAWIQALGALVLSLSSVAPFLLRRVAIYEVAIAGAYCFGMAALYLLATGTLGERPRPWRMALGSLCVGLAAGSRPDLGILLLVCLALLFWLWRSGKATDARTLRRSGALLLGPVLACFVLLALYNQARFGSFAEFGNRFQINGTDAQTRGLSGIEFIPPNLWYYLIAPARFVLAFPFVQLPPPPAYPGTLPSRYGGAEITGGVLTNYPLVLLGLAGLVLLAIPRTRRALGGLGMISGAFTVLGLVLSVAIAYLLFGCTERYEVDFSTLLLLGGLLVWVGVRSRLGSRLGRGLLSTVATAFALFGIGIGTAIGFTGYFNALQVARPGTFHRLQGFFGPVPTLATMLLGRPVITQINNPQGYTQAKVTYTTSGPGGSTFWMDLRPAIVTVASPKSEQAGLRATVGRGLNLRPHSRVWLEVTTSRSKARVPVTGANVVLPAKFHRGLNDITLQVITSRPPPLPASNYAVGQVVGVANLVVGPASK